MNIKGNRYELCLILPSDLGEKDKESTLKEIKDYLKEADLEIESEDIWGLRNFAYTIKGSDKGFYILYYLRGGNPEKMNNLTKELNILKQLVRFLLIKIPDDYEPMPAEKIYEATEKMMAEYEEKEKEQASILQEQLDKITANRK